MSRPRHTSAKRLCLEILASVAAIVSCSTLKLKALSLSIDLILLDPA